MATKSQGSAEVGEVKSHHIKYKDILKQHHLLLMETLDPHLFIEMLDPFLRSQIHEKMTKAETTRQLLQNLSRGPVEMFDNFCKVIAGLNPNVFQQLQGREPTREESDLFFKSFYEELCAGIINAGSRTDNEVDKRIDLDIEFVKLKLTDRQFDEANSTASSYRETGSESSDTDEEYDAALGHQLGVQTLIDEDIDMAEILPQDFSGKSVLMQGRAGVGKSTLTQYVAREWAKGNWGTAFTGVFLLNMRKLVHVDQKLSLSELLGMYAEYVTEMPDPEKPSIKWLEENAERVLIFADGIDELPELGKLLKRTPKIKALNLKATALDWCLNLIQKNVLPQCTTVVVSRPFIGLRHLKYDREIEVVGLTPDMVMQFVDRNVQSSRKEAVKGTLSKNPLLLSICSITFYCSAICKVLEKDTSLDGASLTTYTRITAYIITQFVSRNAAEECTFSVIPEEFAECLTEMAALAYHGLLGSGQDNTRLVFDQTDFNKVGFTPKKMKAAKKTGLLLYKDVKTPMGPQLQAEFVHLSIQEFLAMASLAKAGEQEVRHFFKSSLGRFDMSKLFAFGLFMDKNSPDITSIRQAIIKDKTPDVMQVRAPVEDNLKELLHELCEGVVNDEKSLLNLMHIAYECQRVDMAQVVGKVAAPQGLFELIHRQLKLVDLKAIFYCLTHTKVHKIRCSNILVDEILGEEIRKYVQRYPYAIELEFLGTNITDTAMLHLTEGVKSSKALHHLHFVDNDITDQSMHYISNAVACSQSLNSLTFRYGKITDEGIKILFKGIQISRRLKFLKLADLDIRAAGMKHLSDGIAHATSIESLHLRGIAFSNIYLQEISCDSSCEQVCEKVHRETKFSRLRELCHGIRRATSITRLVFESCQFGNDGINILCCEGIKDAKSLICLEIDNEVILGMCMQGLSTAVSSCKNLKMLSLWRCILKENASEILSRCVASSGIEHLQLGLRDYIHVLNFSDVFPFSCKLRHVTLGGYFPEKAFLHIAQSIAFSKSIPHLEFKALELSPERMLLLSNAIVSCNCLRHLQFSNCILKQEEVRHVSSILSNTRCQLHLTFKDMDFSSASLKLLAQGIASSATLERLEFISGTLTGDGIGHIYEAIKSAKGLKTSVVMK